MAHQFQCVYIFLIFSLLMDLFLSGTAVANRNHASIVSAQVTLLEKPQFKI